MKKLLGKALLTSCIVAISTSALSDDFDVEAHIKANQGQLEWPTYDEPSTCIFKAREAQRESDLVFFQGCVQRQYSSGHYVMMNWNNYSEATQSQCWRESYLGLSDDGGWLVGDFVVLEQCLKTNGT